VTPKSIRSADDLRRQLTTVRRDAIAYSFEEQVPGIVGIARPVFGPNDSVVGSISIATAAIRFDKRAEAQIAEALAHAIRTLSQQLRQIALLPPNASMPPVVEASERM
jgi:DNA-binding IclR family transcriptional regulator